MCAGSLPAGLPTDWYGEVVESARRRGVFVAVDTSGAPLADSLSAQPDLVKPNVHELAELTGRVSRTLGDVIDAAQEVRTRGARTVLASLGSDGAVLVDDEGALWGHAAVDRVVSTVGAGDAMLAGYLSCRRSRTDALATALGWGAAAVQHEGTLFSPSASRVPVTLIDTIDPNRALHDSEPIGDSSTSREGSLRVNPTMEAVVIHGREDYRLERVPVPVPGPGEALVKVQAVGICASDLKCFHGAPMYWGDGPVPPNVDLLATPGHEFVGEIVAVDDLGRQRWSVDTGDRVVAEQIVPCWKCRFCRRGQYWMCAPHNIFGFRRVVNGAMAEYMIFPADAIVHKVSHDVPAAHAAFAEPLSCALHAVERARIEFGDVVVVAGCGPIGLGMIAGARAKSPAHVIALDHVPAKLDLAAECGADITINVGTDDADAVVRDLTEGYGADVYLDATGHPSAVSSRSRTCCASWAATSNTGCSPHP